MYSAARGVGFVGRLTVTALTYVAKLEIPLAYCRIYHTPNTIGVPRDLVGAPKGCEVGPMQSLDIVCYHQQWLGAGDFLVFSAQMIRWQPVPDLNSFLT